VNAVAAVAAADGVNANAREPASGRLGPWSGAQELMERSRRLLGRMHAEDREEAIDLHERSMPRSSRATPRRCARLRKRSRNCCFLSKVRLIERGEFMPGLPGALSRITRLPALRSGSGTADAAGGKGLAVAPGGAAVARGPGF